MKAELHPGSTPDTGDSVTVIFEDAETDFGGVCRTGGELVLSYVDTWRRNFDGGQAVTGARTLPPGMNSNRSLELRAVSARPDHVDICVFDTEAQRGARYVVRGQDGGGVELSVAVTSSIDEATEGQSLRDGAEKARVLSSIADFMLAIDAKQ